MGVAQEEEGAKARVGEPGNGCRVFVSYRREDSADATDRLADALAGHFGPDRIFIDIDNIDLGADFVQAIENWVGSCDALLVVIGPRWATAIDRAGRKRLDDPHDYVRLEVEAGLRRRDVRVIPLLIHGAEIPPAEELPESLQALRRRNALQIDRKNWRHDVARLCKTLEHLESRPDRSRNTAEPTSRAARPGQGSEGVLSSSTTINCLKCGTVNDAGATYCRNCGFSLFDDPPEADRLVEPPRARHREVVLEPMAVKLLPGEQAQMFARASDDRPDADLRWELAGPAAGFAISSETTPGVQITLHPGTDEPPARLPLDVRCFERAELVGEAHGTVEVLRVKLAVPEPREDTSRAETRTVEPPVQPRDPRLAGAPRVGEQPMRAAAAVAAGGVLVVIVSLFLPGLDDHTPLSRYRLFAIGVICLCAALLVLIRTGVRSSRKGPLLAATGLAFALLGEAFPLSWFNKTANGFVVNSGYHAEAGFWLGVFGATLAAVGAALAWCLADAEGQRTGDGRAELTPPRLSRTVLITAGPLVVIGALFLSQFNSVTSKTIWQRWSEDAIRRYPVGVVLLCVVLVALAVAGVRLNRRRLLLMAGAVGLLLVGETLPLLHLGPYSGYGLGFWIGAVGAVGAVVGVAVVAAGTNRDTAPTVR